ncbi:MAG: NAD(P)H-hydrate dehydratase [Oligosphaeraceae bacterium]|nr:NAD(P)H-hydrate dehydratase [Oligosphaeraceae bacterium]
MQAVSVQEMRELEQRFCQETGTAPVQLMENAGQAVAREASALAAHAGARQFAVLAGKGNNGGDACVAARLLLEQGADVQLFLAAAPEQYQGEAGLAWQRLPATLKNQCRREFKAEMVQRDCILIDGLLGTGFAGPGLRQPYCAWITEARNRGGIVLAVDVPSGLNADDGSATLCLEADLTLTFAVPKRGLLLGEGPRCCGRLLVADIGIPATYLPDSSDGLQTFSAADALALLKREDFTTYKNRRGHVGVIGGSRLYPHAPALSAEAALRTGAGLVTLALPQSCELFCSLPKALMVRRVADGGSGFCNAFALPQLTEMGRNFQALVCGPGWGQAEESLVVLQSLLASRLPLVLDADGLNLLAAHPECLPERPAALILTPHPGEMARLQNAFGLESTGSRLEQAQALAHRSRTVVVLKGCRSVVAAPDGRAHINLSGCPALATAGSGDVLAGICGAFLGQGRDAYEAAALAVFLHGLAGEILRPIGSRGIIADDLPGALPAAWSALAANL